MSLALAGGLSTPGPPGKSRHLTFYALPFDTTISQPFNNTFVSLALQELFKKFFRLGFFFSFFCHFIF